LLAAFGLIGLRPVQAQSTHTASRRADLQVGVGYSRAFSDYSPFGSQYQFNGLALYTSLDLSNHLGAEFDFHNMPSSGTQQAGVYERTYEWGLRYHIQRKRLLPYARVMYGRGVFNFPNNGANLAFNMLVVGGGSDVILTRRINLRADYEYQQWFGFPPHGLTPQIITIGVAYHFPGDLAHGRHY
jgi:hypothetical protein